MRTLLLTTLTLCSLATLSGCFPVRVTASPEVTGVITLDGAVTRGTEVFVQEWFKGTCQASRDSAATDTAGRVHRRVPAQVGNVGPWRPTREWAVCIRHDQRWFLGYAEMHMGYPPRNLHVTCELKREMTQGGKNDTQNCRKEEA